MSLLVQLPRLAGVTTSPVVAAAAAARQLEPGAVGATAGVGGAGGEGGSQAGSGGSSSGAGGEGASAGSGAVSGAGGSGASGAGGSGANGGAGATGGNGGAGAAGGNGGTGGVMTGGAAGTGGTGGGLTFPLEDFCEETASIVCEALEGCCSDNFGYNKANCEIIYKAECANDVLAVSQGKKTYHPQFIDECYSALAGYYDACRPTIQDYIIDYQELRACNLVFQGMAQPGRAVRKRQRLRPAREPAPDRQLRRLACRLGARHLQHRQHQPSGSWLRAQPRRRVRAV